MKPIINNEIFTFITDRSVPNVVPGMYEVSTYGRVITHGKRKQELKPVMTKNGYYRVNIRTMDGKSLYHLLHRIVMLEFCPIPSGSNLQVNHIDGDKSHNMIWNLEWVTPSRNITHAFNNGLKSQYHGEDCSWASITNKQAEKIGQLLSTTHMSHNEIANIVGCHINIVDSISCGNTWRDIYDKYNLADRKKKYVLKLSDEQLHMLFKYFEMNAQYYNTKYDLYRAALKDLFNIEFTQNMSGTMSRLYNRITRKDISDNYTF